MATVRKFEDKRLFLLFRKKFLNGKNNRNSDNILLVDSR